MLWNLYIWRSSELGWERSQPNHEQRLGLKEVPPSLPLLYDFLRENILKTTMKETAFNLIIAAFSVKIAKSSLIKTLLSWRHSWFFHSFQTPYSISSRKKWSKFIHSFPWCMPAKKKKKNLHFTAGLRTADCGITPSVQTSGVFYSFWLHCPASHRQYAITSRKIKDITQQWCMTLPSCFFCWEAQYCSKAPISRWKVPWMKHPLHFCFCKGKVKRLNLAKQHYAASSSDSNFPDTSQTSESPRTAACVFLHALKVLIGIF